MIEQSYNYTNKFVSTTHYLSSSLLRKEAFGCDKLKKVGKCLGLDRTPSLIPVDFFLAHLSFRAFLIAFRPLVCLFVNFSHFHLLLQNHWANFNQIWHKASLGEGDSMFYKSGPFNSQKGDNRFSSPNQLYDIIIALLKCIYWFELVSQVLLL